MLFNATISLLILCLEDLSIVGNEVLKSPTMTVLLSISLLKSSKIFLMYLGGPMLGTYCYKDYILLLGQSLKYYVVTFFVIFCGFCFEVFFV